MKNDKYDQYICDIFITSKKKINGNKIRKLFKYKNINNYLLNRFNDEDNINIIIWRIYYKIEERIKCKICGKLTKFDNKIKKYKEYCCASCAAKSEERNNKYKKTCLQKYGHINPLHSNDIKEKKIRTWINKYGVDNPLKSKIIKNKSKQTCLEKYGVEYSFQSINNIQKSKKTKLEKYGDENFINLEKRKQTCLEKYNVNFLFQSNYFKQKSKETLLNKYGVDNIMKLSSIKNKVTNSEIRKQNEYKTKKTNHTFNTSITEKESYYLLKEKYPDVLTQYKSNNYPFACDFYIPSLNLYIECNYHWTHGGHPYNINDIDDYNKLKLWESKNTKYYRNAIVTWTCRDVNKRNIAKQNNLNYKEFFTFLELNNWINK